MKKIRELNRTPFLIIITLFSALILTGVILITYKADATETYVEAPSASEYEVYNVNLYVQNETNGYGAITGSHMAYSFTYIDENGNIKEETDFRNYKEGTTRVKIGKENKYVIDNYVYTLYLTKDTFSTLQYKNP